jgi:hypothetical protein
LDDSARKERHLNNRRQVDYNCALVTSDLNLVDFGLSEFLGENLNSMDSLDSDFEADRNPLFSSRWVLLGYPYTKRDDAISIVYNILCLMDPDDSWFKK